MKKVLAIAMALALAVSMGITAYADGVSETVGENGSKEINVTAEYKASTNIPSVYSVDIVWSSMKFVYTENSTKNWNASDHSYDTSVFGGWDKTSATVTVTNHSNVDVDVAVEYSAVENIGITGTIANPSAALSAGEEGNYDGAASHTATLTISGTPTSEVTSDGVKIGTIKITIS